MRTTEWSLRNDGTMERRTVKSDNGRIYRHFDGWQSNFRGVKGVALISQTATYDTFLMTHTTGRLYTARFPVAGGHIMASDGQTDPDVDLAGVRDPGRRALRHRHLLLGIDKDTGAGYLTRSVTRNGLSTVITGHGKVPGTFNDPVYFRWANYADPLLFGE